MKFLKIRNSDEKIQVCNIFCVGKNYMAHIKEMNSEIPEEPVIFMKPASTLIFNEGPVHYPDHTENLHYEAELVLLIGKTIKNASLEEADDAIIGYATGLDMTLRDVQKKLKNKGLPWTLAKCFDDSAVLSDVILKKEYQLKEDENISLYQNGELKQRASLSLMINKIAEVVKFLSERITLHKGDLIYTGTPAGVGAVKKGDKLIVKIDNLPDLKTEII